MQLLFLFIFLQTRGGRVFPADDNGGGMECGVCTTVSDVWRTPWSGGGGGGCAARQYSQESEHDLAVMVSDFLENGSGCNGNGCDYSRCSSDSDSSFSDLLHLSDKVSFFKPSVDQYESDLLSVVQSLLLSMDDKELKLVKCGFCNGSCIRSSLVKLLRSSGYDAAVCSCKWQGCNKVPGGDHEYIDVVNYFNDRTSERLIIDIDFQSHFEIARAINSYNNILKSLPVVFVGSLTKLKQILQVMAEAARVSLKQNSMPLPPWRSLAYLQAKWHSPYQRNATPNKNGTTLNSNTDRHKQCHGHLRRLKSSLKSEIETQRLILKSRNNNTSRSLKHGRRASSFRFL